MTELSLARFWGYLTKAEVEKEVVEWVASEVGERFVIGIVGGDDSVDVVNGKSLID